MLPPRFSYAGHNAHLARAVDDTNALLAQSEAGETVPLARICDILKAYSVAAYMPLSKDLLQSAPHGMAGKSREFSVMEDAPVSIMVATGALYTLAKNAHGLTTFTSVHKACDAQ